MSRFFWLVRREVWEHKAIWVAPAIVIACMVLLVVTGNVHFGKLDGDGASVLIDELTRDQQTGLLLIVYAGLALVVFMVMGVIGFFYALDSLYADRRDRSVLFWKSLPLSDAETVLSKFSVAIVVIPVVAAAAAIVAQFVVALGISAKLSLAGLPADVVWQPQAIMGGIVAALLWCVTAILWYAPVIGYLMLASAWAPRGPFLWAVLPPVAIWVLERMVMHSEYVGDFITQRLFGMYSLLDSGDDSGARDIGDKAGDRLERITDFDIAGALKEFYSSPELWLGVLAAAALLAAAMWVRRYRDETA